MSILDDDGFGTDFDYDNGDMITVHNVFSFVNLHGDLTINSDGSYEYIATNDALPQGETSVEWFRYEIKDILGTGVGIITADLLITVTGINDAPISQNDSFTVSDDITASHVFTTNVLANESDVEGGTFTVNDINPIDDMGNVLIAGDIISLDAPVAQDDQLSTTDNAAAISGNVITEDNGSGTDFDIDNGDMINITNGGIFALSHGALELTPDGGYNYTPTVETLSQGEVVTDSFTYTLTDQIGATDTAEIKILVTGVNDTPVAQDDQFSTTEDGSTISGNVITSNNGSGIDFDVDNGDIIDIQNPGIKALPHGILILAANGDYSYTSTGDLLALGESATDTYTYVLKDLAGATDTTEM